MLNNELLDILCCPETKQDLKLIDEQTKQKINDKIKSGELKNRGGETIKETIDTGLLREDHKYLYPVREDIPIMLIDEAIPFEQFDASSE
ncbi:MAG TPA: Trm112 family protein [Chitinispirillaceae bacterium]|nr:Trm112 family protein [Chitinispirillaceae bacterium]